MHTWQTHLHSTLSRLFRWLWAQRIVWENIRVLVTVHHWVLSHVRKFERSQMTSDSQHIFPAERWGLPHSGGDDLSRKGHPIMHFFERTSPCSEKVYVLNSLGQQMFGSHCLLGSNDDDVMSVQKPSCCADDEGAQNPSSWNMPRSGSQRQKWVRMTEAHYAPEKKPRLNEAIKKYRGIIMSMHLCSRVGNFVARYTDMGWNPLEFQNPFRVFCRQTGINDFSAEDDNLVGVLKSNQACCESVKITACDGGICRRNSSYANCITNNFAVSTDVQALILPVRSLLVASICQAAVAVPLSRLTKPSGYTWIKKKSSILHPVYLLHCIYRQRAESTSCWQCRLSSLAWIWLVCDHPGLLGWLFDKEDPFLKFYGAVSRNF